ncbi:integral membrane protein GPR155-like [Limulus polyphemus]|uniref:Integral membrane protein GPR155-like n=1 Tax=Limulus polyphemus TaxID=6850 RepID=A0ABM1S2U7_LIMPO|nr:integral membrane protein GPR155-like [Limulus polyphemus]
MAFEYFVPTLLQCFVVILCGYLAGRTRIMMPSQAIGLNTFVTYFSLPAVIILSIATINLESVHWKLLGGLMLSKVIIFILVAVGTLLLSKPINLAMAGLYAIFCTQCNDLGIGIPIVSALYATTQPLFPRYMYLLTPLTLALLNPVSFILMEVEKIRQYNKQEALAADDDKKEKTTQGIQSSTFLQHAKHVFKLSWIVALGIIKNPDFSLLYGVIPPGTTVLLFANQYGLPTDMMWVGVYFLYIRRWKRMPYPVALCLAVARAILAFGVFLWSLVNQETKWIMYANWILITSGQFSSRLWTVILAFALVLVAQHKSDQASKFLRFMLVVGFGKTQSLVVNIWKIRSVEPSGSRMGMEFVEAVMNFGQGFFLFIIFGLDVRTLSASLVKSWRNLRYGKETPVLPPVDELDQETCHVCYQFVTYHFDSVIQQLPKDITWKNRTFKSVFSGKQLVDWLIKVGLAHNCYEAEEYGQKLLNGRVIRHIRDAHYFYDSPFLYEFIPHEHEH